MVILLPGVDSGGDSVRRPLLRRCRHAEGFGGIERDGVYNRLLLARIMLPRRPWPGRLRQGR